MVQFAKLLACLVIACGSINSPQSSPGGSAPKNHHSAISKAYAKALPVLHKKTSVPLRLPTQGLGLEGEQDLFAIVESADDTTYIVDLAATPDCYREHACSYGTFVGTSRPLHEIQGYGFEDREGISVGLRHGLKGRYYKGLCGAYCSDSRIVWTEGRFHYIIGLKAATKRDIVRSANSSIRGGSSPSY